MIRDKSSEAYIDVIELLISSIPSNERKIKSINHISDAGSESRSDTFRKWCSGRKIRFTTTAPKYQEQNELVETLGDYFKNDKYNTMTC